MKDILDTNADESELWRQYRQAVDAVIERAIDKEELYLTVVADQLLFVAASLMLERENDVADGLLKCWCNETIESMDAEYKSTRALVDRLLAEQSK